MIVFVYGDDHFRVAEKARTLREAFVQKFDPTGMNTADFPAEGGKMVPGEVLQAVSSAPFMSEKRLVIIRDLITNGKKEEEKLWLEGLSKTPDSTILILCENASVKQLEKRSLFKKLSDNAEVHTYPFPKLEGPALQQWVLTRVKESGGQIESTAARMLVDRVGADLWQLDNEIQKLIAYANTEPIGSKMVEEMVRASFDGEIFALIDAVSRKQTAKALQLLQEERASGGNDFYLMSMLARQVRILLSARALLDDEPRTTKDELAAQMNMHPFVAQKALQQAREFVYEDLVATHDLLFRYDREMKSGGISAPLAVDLISIKLAM